MRILLFLGVVVLFLKSNAQPPLNISSKDSLSIEKYLDSASKALEKKWKAEERFLEEDESVLLKLALDTFKIENRMSFCIDKDGTTLGMLAATYNAEKEYDMLLNELYKHLLKVLTKTDEAILKKAQRAWVSYKEAEKELNALAMDEKYSGGGSIQYLFHASRSLEITQNRVFELADYLNRMKLSPGKNSTE